MTPNCVVTEPRQQAEPRTQAEQRSWRAGRPRGGRASSRAPQRPRKPSAGSPVRPTSSRTAGWHSGPGTPPTQAKPLFLSVGKFLFPPRRSSRAASGKARKKKGRPERLPGRPAHTPAPASTPGAARHGPTAPHAGPRPGAFPEPGMAAPRTTAPRAAAVTKGQPLGAGDHPTQPSRPPTRTPTRTQPARQGPLPRRGH